MNADHNRKHAAMVTYLLENLEECAANLRQWELQILHPHGCPGSGLCESDTARWNDTASYPVPHLRELVKLCEFGGNDPFKLAKNQILYEVLAVFTQKTLQPDCSSVDGAQAQLRHMERFA